MAIVPDKAPITTHSGGMNLGVRHSTVSERGMSHIQEMLANLYANPVEAVVREYLTNAVDSHRMAGVSAPVKVTTPSILGGELVIEDRGLGMSSEDIDRHYLAWGESSKTLTNDAVGRFGIGAKSAFAVVDSFVVEAVKDGRKNIVRVAKDLNHNNLLVDAPTDETDGVKVIIPGVRNQLEDSWYDMVYRVASYHPRGTVEVDGNVVSTIHDKLGWIDGCLYDASGNSYYGSSDRYVISGGTRFEIPSHTWNQITSGISSYFLPSHIILPIGSFDVPPPRDTVQDTERTRDAITKVLRRSLKTLDNKVDQYRTRLSQMDLTVMQEVKDTYGKGVHNHIFGNLHWDFQGAHSFNVGASALLRTATGSYRRSSTLRLGDIETHLVVITGATTEQANLAGTFRYISENKANAGIVVFTGSNKLRVSHQHRALNVLHENSTAGELMDAAMFPSVDYAEVAEWIAANKAERKKNNIGLKNELPFNLTVFDSEGESTSTESTRADLHNLTGEVAYTYDGYTSASKLLRDVTVVHLGRKSEEKFISEFPNFITLSDLRAARRKKVWDGLDDETKRVAANYFTFSNCRSLRSDHVESLWKATPAGAVKDAIAEARYDDFSPYVDDVYLPGYVTEDAAKDSGLNRLISRYPLIQHVHMTDETIPEIVTYMQAVEASQS